MRPVLRKRHPPVGSRPGTLVQADGAVPPRIRVMRYDRDQLETLDQPPAASLRELVRDGQVAWIDVQGLGDEAVLRSIAAQFDIHALALEDVVNAPQRPKFEDYPGHLLMIARMVRAGEHAEVIAEQVSLFVGPGFVLSFQERYGDVFDPVRQRLVDAKGPIRDAGADYLAYVLLDTIVDGYYPVLEEISEELSRLEIRITRNPAPRQLDRLNELKFSVIALQRGITPQRDVLARMLRDGSAGFSDGVRVYLRDTYDHCAQLTDALDTARELTAGLLNTYLSLVSNRTNEVMKVLTVTASIFIPLTFLAGLYGMNFERMPELHSEWGYPILLATMAVIAILLIRFFRKRGWIGTPEDEE